MSISERGYSKLAKVTTNIKPLSFLEAQQKAKLASANLKITNTTIKSLPTVALEINDTITKSLSFFSDPKNITALRREHIRTSKLEDRSAKLVSVGLHILDNMVCLQNPSNLDVDYMNRLALAFFKQAARAKNAFGIYLVGVAKIYGFCDPKDIPTGLKQIEEAAKLKCAEAQNFKALCFAKANFSICQMMFRDAAKGGHPQALINYNNVTKSVGRRKARNVAALRQKTLRHRRVQRRKRLYSYARPS